MVAARTGKIKAVVNLKTNIDRNMTDPVRQRAQAMAWQLKIQGLCQIERPSPPSRCQIKQAQRVKGLLASEIAFRSTGGKHGRLVRELKRAEETLLG